MPWNLTVYVALSSLVLWGLVLLAAQRRISYPDVDILQWSLGSGPASSTKAYFLSRHTDITKHNLHSNTAVTVQFSSDIIQLSQAYEDDGMIAFLVEVVGNVPSHLSLQSQSFRKTTLGATNGTRTLQKEQNACATVQANSDAAIDIHTLACISCYAKQAGRCHT